MGYSYCSRTECGDLCCALHQANAPSNRPISIADRSECHLFKKRKSVQMVSDNYDIKQNPKVRERYPQLYEEVIKHDRLSSSSWYNLSETAYKEYLSYREDEEIGYVS